MILKKTREEKRVRLITAILFYCILTLSCSEKRPYVSSSSLNLDIKGLDSISDELGEGGVNLNQAPNRDKLSLMTYQEINENIDRLKNYVGLSKKVLITLEEKRIQGSSSLNIQEELVRQNLSNARAYLDMLVVSDWPSRFLITDQAEEFFVGISETSQKNIEEVESLMPLNVSELSKDSDKSKLSEAVSEILNLESVTDKELKELAQLWERLSFEFYDNFSKITTHYIHMRFKNQEVNGSQNQVNIDVEHILTTNSEKRFSNAMLLAFRALMMINFELTERGFPISEFSKNHNFIYTIPFYERESTLDRAKVMQLFSLQESIVSHSLGFTDPLNTQTGRSVYNILVSTCSEKDKPQIKYENECPLRGEVKITPSVNPINNPNYKLSHTFEMDFQFVDSDVNENIDLNVKSIRVVLVGSQAVNLNVNEIRTVSIDTRIELTDGKVYDLRSIKKVGLSSTKQGAISDMRVLEVQVYSQNKKNPNMMTATGKILLQKEFILQGSEFTLLRSHYAINDKILTADEVQEVFVGEKLVTQ